MPKKRKISKKKIIRFRSELFWDVDPKTIDLKKHAEYIIERILDFGNNKEVYWLVHYYPHRIIRDTVHTSRVLDPKSKALWTLVWE